MQSHKGIHGLAFVLCWALTLAAPHGRQKRWDKDCCGNLGHQAEELFDAYKNDSREILLPANIRLHFIGLPNCTFSEPLKAEEGCAAVTAFLGLLKQFNASNDRKLNITGWGIPAKITQLAECRRCFEQQETRCPDGNISYTKNDSFTVQKMIYYYAFQEYQSCMLNFTSKIQSV